MKRPALILLLLLLIISSQGQSNISLSNPAVLPVLEGKYNPAALSRFIRVSQPDSVVKGIVHHVSKDTLIRYLTFMDSKHNRNTGSDTVSENHGIGSVRRWIFSKLNEYRKLSGNRLLTSYMDFDQPICGQTHHRNVLAVLPGLDTTSKEILLVEGHFDTRCEGACDTSCYSPGMDDNGSGTVLVMELARIMSRYSFNHTIVFACTTGEDEGLWGAKALSQYLFEQHIEIRAVLNNDVVGGITCGHTASPPGCPGLNAVDSTHIRVFSFSPGNDSSAASSNKQLARYIRLTQEEHINPLIKTPMTVDIMIAEDRTGRGGDHMPFRQKGYTAIRFTSHNEYGDGRGLPGDRQHTVRDILGVDTSIPPDGIIDSFYVDMNYLGRNIIMNGVNLGLLALAPPKPAPEFIPEKDGIRIRMHGADAIYKQYRVGIRSRQSGSLYFDKVYTFKTDNIFIRYPDPHKKYFISAANVKNGVEGLFCDEYSVNK